MLYFIKIFVLLYLFSSYSNFTKGYHISDLESSYPDNSYFNLDAEKPTGYISNEDIKSFTGFEEKTISGLKNKILNPIQDKSSFGSENSLLVNRQMYIVEINEHVNDKNIYNHLDNVFENEDIKNKIIKNYFSTFTLQNGKFKGYYGFFSKEEYEKVKKSSDVVNALVDSPLSTVLDDKSKIIPLLDIKPIDKNTIRNKKTIDEISGIAEEKLLEKVNINQIVSGCGYNSCTPTNNNEINNLVKRDIKIPYKRVKRISKIDTKVYAENIAYQPLFCNHTFGWNLKQISLLDSDLCAYMYNPSAGKNVTIYVVDGGIDINHPEFEGRAIKGHNGLKKHSNHIEIPHVPDYYSHGTHVAAIAAGKNVGAAKKAKIVDVKVFHSYETHRNSSIKQNNKNDFVLTTGTDSSLLSGLEYIDKNMKEGDKAIINFSISWTPNCLITKAIKSLSDKGAVIVKSAGNTGGNNCTWGHLKEFGAVIVGNLRNNYTKNPESCYGKCVEIWAPGTEIYSAFNGGGYVAMSGTSMAAPLVAGVAATFLSMDNIKSGKKIPELLNKYGIRGELDDKSIEDHDLLLFNNLGRPVF